MVLWVFLFDKMDLIRSQIGVDWSKLVVEDADLNDLDPEAIAYARELFIKNKMHQRNQQKCWKKCPMLRY